MRHVELRSDTMTRPTPAMRKAMAEAEVGDDVFGEDPTVNRLEEMAAERLGKEAALFVPSGTMANLVSQMAHCGRGDEMILGSLAHSFYYEQGGSAAVAAIHPRTVPNQPDGKLPLDELEAAIRSDNIHFPRTRLIALENTHNLCGGAPLEPAYLRAVGDIARRHGIKLHVDGARLFNAAVALGRSGAAARSRSGFGLFLPQQGAGGAGGFGRLRQPGVHPDGAPRPQGPGRRHAPGRRAGGGRHRGPDRNGRPAGRGPRQRAPARRGSGRHLRPRAGPRTLQNQHRLLRRGQAGPERGGAGRRPAEGRRAHARRRPPHRSGPSRTTR
ncbi:MAG: aminotransferase class I/II-fold pyridoxal phosphate-dependent enzyme [Desulfosudis oleivorans]|nr:aminotransferase class I/II-fold pyridoxal phosphate-dependent enzyme [Desulfosudis oleivorans]